MTKTSKTNWLLLIATIVLIAFPLLFVNGEFGGSDDQGTELIQKFKPGYKAWAKPVWTPPSGEVESLIFTVQGSLGTGIICYILGVAHGKKKARKELGEQHSDDKSA